jgi:hypothetical protein
MKYWPFKAVTTVQMFSGVGCDVTNICNVDVFDSLSKQVYSKSLQLKDFDFRSCSKLALYLIKKLLALQYD